MWGNRYFKFNFEISSSSWSIYKIFRSWFIYRAYIYQSAEENMSIKIILDNPTMNRPFTLKKVHSKKKTKSSSFLQIPMNRIHLNHAARLNTIVSTKKYCEGIYRLYLLNGLYLMHLQPLFIQLRFVYYNYSCGTHFYLNVWGVRRR